MKSHNITRTTVDGIIQKDFDISSCTSEITEIVRNNIEARCSIIRGEVLYNILLGIPLKMSSGEERDLTIMDIINNTTGVGEINKFSSKIVNKKYIANAIVLTTASSVINVEV
ncbi:MAG: hypothetical protein RR342_01065 [Bacilli bacterium]